MLTRILGRVVFEVLSTRILSLVITGARVLLFLMLFSRVMLLVMFFASVMLFVVVHFRFSFTLKIHRYKKQLTRQMKPVSTKNVTAWINGKYILESVGLRWEIHQNPSWIT
jgi:hypothetical protein